MYRVFDNDSISQYFEFYDDALMFARFNACAILDLETGEIIDDFREDMKGDIE